MRRDDFQLYADIIKENSGITLTDDKVYLLEARLGGVARRWGTEDLTELANTLRENRDPELIENIIEVMTTNETSFFRDIRPFNQLRDVIIPDIIQSKHNDKTLRIWSAASSSGQEAYSIAMTLNELANQLSGWTIEIIGTDISKEMITKAKLGLYSQFEVQRGLPINMLVKYFTQIGDRWEISDRIKGMVSFKHMNILNQTAQLGVFDVIFCRNVLIYFDMPTKSAVLHDLSSRLSARGMLVLGGAETVLGVTPSFKPMSNHRGIYVKASSDLSISERVLSA